MAMIDRKRPSLFSRKIFSSLKNPVFRLYYGAMLCHRAAMNMQIVARSLLIYRLSGSAVILGSVALAHALPMLCVSLFGGVIADRVHKKYVLLIGQASSAVVGMGHAARMTLGNTLLMYYTEDKYRGRVMSFYEMEHGLTSLGVFGTGLLAEAVGVQWALGGFAIVLVFLSLLALVFVPRIRRLD